MANKRVGDVIYNNFDQYTGQPFNTKILSELPDGTVITDELVDNTVVFKNKPEHGGGYSVRSEFLEKNKIHVTWFGVKGDGSDESELLERFFSTNIMPGSVFDLDGLNIITTIPFERNVSLHLINGTISVNSPLPAMLFKLSNGEFIFDGVKINCNNTTNYGIEAGFGISKFHFINGSVFDLKEVEGNGISTFGIRIFPGLKDIRITKSLFRNIVPIDNAVPGDSQGAARALHIGQVQDCVIDDCIFDNIQSMEDGDSVHVSSGYLDESLGKWNTSEVTVKNSKFYNVRKRAIKFQAAGCSVFNCSFSNPLEVSGDVIAAFDSDTIIDNCVFDFLGVNTCINISNIPNASINNIVISNNKFKVINNTLGTRFIGLNSNVSNININNNHFDGIIPDVLINTNGNITQLTYENNVGKMINSNNYETVSIRDSVIRGNKFENDSEESSTRENIAIANATNVEIYNNFFINSFSPIRPKGVMGVNLIIGQNTLIRPQRNLILVTDLVESGAENIKVLLNSERRVIEGTGIPTSGSYLQGDFIINKNNGFILGWRCTTSGSPGFWAPVETSIIDKGSGSPNGSVSRSYGRLYIDEQSGEFYIKTTASGTFGWEPILHKKSAPVTDIPIPTVTTIEEANTAIQALVSKVNELLQAERDSGQMST